MPLSQAGPHYTRALPYERTTESLRGCDLSGQDLDGVYLAKADLQRANLEGAALTKAHLSGAHLRHARLDSSTSIPDAWESLVASR